METIESFEVGDLIVRIHPDYDGGDFADPRKNNENLSVMVMDHRRYDIGDRKLDSDEEDALSRGGWPLLRRYLRMSKNVIAITKIGMYDHSGITIYPVADGGNGHYMFDSAGWDSGIVGFAYITRESWTLLCGDTDPFAEVDDVVRLGMGQIGVTRTAVSKQLAAEIEEYDTFLRGEVYGYSVTKPHHVIDPECDDDPCSHDEVLDSCWGFLGDIEYVKTEAKASAEYHVAHPTADAFSA